MADTIPKALCKQLFSSPPIEGPGAEEENQRVVIPVLECRASRAISTAGSLALGSYERERIIVFMGSERCMKNFTSLKKRIVQGALCMSFVQEKKN